MGKAKIAALVVALAVLVVAQRLGLFHLFGDPVLLKQTLLGLGPAGYVAFVVGYAVLQPIGVPGTMFVIAAALIWSWPVAFALSMVGTMAASVVGFSFARFVARDWVASRIPARFRKYDEALGRHAFLTVFVMRLVFWMPQALHAFFGVSKVRFWTHFWGSLLGYIPPLILMSYFGQEVFAGLRKIPGSVWISIGVASTLLVGALIVVKQKRRARAAALAIFGLLALSPHRVLAIAADLPAQLGIDDDELARVKKGELVQLSKSDTSDRDLAVGFVFTCRLAPGAIAQAFLRGADFRFDPTVVQAKRIVRASDLAALRLAPHGAAESKRYVGATAGETLNLSEPESASFRALGAAADTAMVEAQLHKMLLARLESYRKKGLSALAPYARDNGERRDLGEGLRVFSQAPGALQRYTSLVERTLRAYPKMPEGATEAFYSIVYDHDDRPTVTLRHRFGLVIDDVNLLVDREFYVSQGYNEMQALMGFIPFDGGTLVFYRADTSTDRVSGTSSTVKHSIGRRMMAKQIEDILTRTRTEICR